MFEPATKRIITVQTKNIDLNTLANIPTELDYLPDTYRMNGTATCVGIRRMDNGLYDVLLDRTIFYPKGGGQPSDTGRIVLPQGEFQVKQVALSPTCIVSHMCALISGACPTPGETVELRVSASDRLLNARNHTAGHIIDLAKKNLNQNKHKIKSFLRF